MHKTILKLSAVLFSLFLAIPVTVLAHDEEHPEKGGHGSSTGFKQFEEGSGTSAIDMEPAREHAEGGHGSSEYYEEGSGSKEGDRQSEKHGEYKEGGEYKGHWKSKSRKEEGSGMR
ncbi:hypothetical protein UZ36_00635 [Candidatus Nitromaritima sp. SCGC AAA799-C22]|nr:hypothetical protein UZ36_00635 [Candidatus Nitromaritima sp. SCGC AAA799-C22]